MWFIIVCCNWGGNFIGVIDPLVKILEREVLEKVGLFLVEAFQFTLVDDEVVQKHGCLDNIPHLENVKLKLVPKNTPSHDKLTLRNKTRKENHRDKLVQCMTAAQSHFTPCTYQRHIQFEFYYY